MERAKPQKFFYGWIILAACFLVAAVSGGLFLTFGVFFKPLQDYFGWDRGVISSIDALYVVGMAVSSIFMGRLTDRYGPRITVALAALLLGLGFSLASQTHYLWQIYLFYLIASMGAGVMLAPPSATIQRWFVKRRGFTLGLVLGGTGFGVLIYSPVINALILAYGWQATYIILGTSTWALLTAAALVMEHSPERKGLRPYGADSIASASGKGSPASSRETDESAMADRVSEWSTKEAIKTKQFFILWALWAFVNFPTRIIDVHIVPFALDIGVQRAIATAAMGFIGGVGVAGRIFMGGLADKVGWKKTLIITCFGQGIMLLWLIGTRNLGMLTVFVLVYGLAYGGRLPSLTGLIGYCFGTKSLGEITGIIFGVGISTAALGPIFAGFIFDRVGSYGIAFLIGAFMFVSMGLLTFFIKPPLKTSSGARPPRLTVEKL